METQKQEPEQIKNEVQSLDIEKKETVSEDGTRVEHIKEALEILYKTFPKAFVKDGDIKPLKIGIFDDIKDRASSIEGLSLSKVRHILAGTQARFIKIFAYGIQAGNEVLHRYEKPQRGRTCGIWLFVRVDAPQRQKQASF